MYILEVDINWKRQKHVQQRVQFLPVIILWKCQNFKISYLENVLMKFRENFLTAAACHYLLLIVPTDFLII